MDRWPGSAVHVGLDALALGDRPGGVGRYVLTLLRGLLELERPPRVTLFARAGERPALEGGGIGLEGGGLALRGPGRLFSRAPLRLLWAQLGLPLAARLRRLDLLHGLMGVVPRFCPVPAVVTIHDVTFLTHPALHLPAKVAYYRQALPLAARTARLVLTDSAASRDEILRTLNLAPERVRVVPLAVDPCFQAPGSAAIAAVRARHALAGPFVLYAGVLEPRKNLPVLIEAVLRLRRQGFPHRLVLAGKPGWGLPPIEAAIAAAGDAVRSLGYVADPDLVALLGACDAFAYLPLVEGFGLPVAEALACGVPVVTSDRSSLPEVAGGAALLADPDDPAAVAAALAAVLTDADLRARLARRGVERAAELTPRRLAEGTVAAYHAALHV